MTVPLEDSEFIEMKKIERLVNLEQKEILEVGCGDGRLTFQYADSAKRVAAVDHSRKAIVEAQKSAPKKPSSKLKFYVGRGEKLNFPNNSFDVVFFSWSLCCTDLPAMGKALDEAWRVLRPRGFLINIQSSLHQPFSKGMVSYLLERNAGPDINDDGDRYARLELKHASLVERKFNFQSEEEFPIYSYYGSLRGAIADITSENGIEYRTLEQDKRRQIREILLSMRTRKGIRIQENAVLTVLRKRLDT